MIGCLLIAAAAVSCQTEETVEEEPSLVLSQDIVAVPCEGGNAFTVTVEANNDWEARINEEAGWITVSPMSGKAGKTEISISAEGHLGHKSRMGGVIFDSKTIRKQISVAQAPAPNLDKITLDAEEVDFEYDADKKTVNLTANVDWTAVPDVSGDWFTVTPLEGKAGNATLEINVTKNSGKSGRTVVFAFNGGDAPESTLTIFQEAFESIVPSTYSVEFDSDGNSENNKVTIEANCAWSATSSASWLSINPASGTKGQKVEMSIAAEANTSTKARTGKITLKSANSEEVIEVTQAGYQAALTVLASFKCNVSPQYTCARSPRWATPDDSRNYGVTVTGEGIGYPEEEGSKSYMIWVTGELYTRPSTFAFIAAAEGHYAVNKIAEGDALVWHLFIESAKKGAKVNCKVALRETDATPRHWNLEYSTDNGTNWIAIDTGTSISCSNGKTANIDVLKKNTAYPYQGTFTLPEAVIGKEVLVRTIVVDMISVDNKTRTAANGTVRFTDFTIDGTAYDGPIFTLEQ